MTNYQKALKLARRILALDPRFQDIHAGIIAKAKLIRSTPDKTQATRLYQDLQANYSLPQLNLQLNLCELRQREHDKGGVMIAV